MTEPSTPSEYVSAVTEGARLIWKHIVARSYLDPMTLKYMFIFTPEEMERLSTMTKHNSMRILQSELAESEAQNAKMREGLENIATAIKGVHDANDLVGVAMKAPKCNLCEGSGLLWSDDKSDSRPCYICVSTEKEPDGKSLPTL